jgi:hypothetical protein
MVFASKGPCYLVCLSLRALGLLLLRRPIKFAFVLCIGAPLGSFSNLLEVFFFFPDKQLASEKRKKSRFAEFPTGILQSLQPFRDSFTPAKPLNA